MLKSEPSFLFSFSKTIYISSGVMPIIEPICLKRCYPERLRHKASMTPTLMYKSKICDGKSFFSIVIGGFAGGEKVNLSFRMEFNCTDLWGDGKPESEIMKDVMLAASQLPILYNPAMPCSTKEMRHGLQSVVIKVWIVLPWNNRFNLLSC